MGILCKTNVGDRWGSHINGGPEEGVFSTDPENAEGYFEGIFFAGGVQEKIIGKCDGTVAYFLRPAERPRFYYAGTFNAAGDRINGRRVGLPQFGDMLLADEEWEAIKLPTLAKARDSEG